MKKKANSNILMMSISIIAILVILFVITNQNKGNTENNNAVTETNGSKDLESDKNIAAIIKNEDLIIPVNEISDTAKFYPVEIEGTLLEVVAVKAPDGSLRTAFNTCQVCYDSGRGYYEQEGDALICQNCGNRFTMDQVEVISGGCNPVPITDDNKMVDDTNITISKEFLTEAKVIFGNWKR